MAIDLDELEPQKQPKKPKDLSGFSVAELEDYIAALETEIARARQAIAAKEKHKTGVQSVFKR